MASSASFPSLVFQAVAGLPWNEEGSMPPFKWSTTTLDKKPKYGNTQFPPQQNLLKTNHFFSYRPIDEFNFNAINHTWVLNESSGAAMKGVSSALIG